MQDARGTDAAGVFAAYVDITYDGTLALPTGMIDYGNDFPNGQRGDTSVPGLIDEAGAFVNTITPPAMPAEPQLLFRLPMTTIAVGPLEFGSNPADLLPISDTLLFDLHEVIRTSDINFGATSANVVPEPGHTVLLMMVLGIVVGGIRIRKTG